MKILPLLLCPLLLLEVGAEEEDPLAEARRHFHLRDHYLAERALTERGEELEALRLLADVLLRSGRGEEASAVIERARKLKPEDPLLAAGSWEARLEARDWSDEVKAEVRKDVDAFLAATPEDGQDWRLVAASIGYDLLDAKKAQEKLRERILERMPGELPEAVEGELFEAVIRTRAPEPRAKLIHQFLTLFPGSKQANFLREILLYVRREDRAKLLAEADAALVADPENRRVRAALARWLVESEPADPKRALAEVEKALALVVEPREQDRPELTSKEDWARMLFETEGRYLAWGGRALHLLGRSDDALRWLAEAAARRPYDVNLYLWRGEAAEAVGARDLAVDSFARSLVSGPSPKAKERLETLLPGDAKLRDRLAPRLGPAPRFTDVTEAAGFKGVKGGRVAFGDIDGDGDPDLLVGGSRLFVNRGDGTFERVASLPALPGARGGLFADLDLDGDLDLLVFRTLHPLVLANDGKGAFADRTPDAMRREGQHRTEAAALFDHDGDGLLDVYLANYERRPNPPWARGTHDHLWHNRGKLAFEDASGRVSGLGPEPMCGRGVSAADFDEDGDRDLYVANYRLDPDFLFVNRGRDGLVNEARALGVEGECDEGYFGHGIGVAWGDLDGDGHLDAVVGNLAHPRYIGFSDVTRVFLSSGPPGFTFRDVFRESGIRYEETHSNASLADVDLDGDLDLFLTSIYKGRKSFLYLNDGRAKFRDVTWLAGVRTDNGWGSAFADIDGDGDLDLVVGSGTDFRLFRNDGPTGGFLGLTIEGRDCNSSGVGARVTVEGGGLSLVREVRAGTGTGCQDDASLRFGVGEAKGPFTLTVRWPCGRVQRILRVEPGRVYRLVEGGNPRGMK